MGNNCCESNTSPIQVPENLLVRLFVDPDTKEQKVQTFDISTKAYEHFILSSKIVLEGCSQIQVGSSLYLCGCDSNVSDYDSSSTYSIDISKIPMTVKIEINSNFPHYYPTLAEYKGENIFAFGGKNSTKCEYYSIRLKRWRNMKSLPEERFGADAYIHYPTYEVYLYGGYNSTKGMFENSILKMEIPSFTKWTEISLKDTTDITNRKFTSHCNFDKDTILLLGGEINEGSSDDVIVWSFEKKEDEEFSFQKTKLRLPLKEKFIINKSCKINRKEKLIYCFVQDDNSLMKIDMISGLSEEQSLADSSSRLMTAIEGITLNN